MKIIVTGGRDYNNYTKVKEELTKLFPTTIVQGGATGTDLLAARFAKENGITSITFKADWEQYGKAAGPIRNGEMLKAYRDAIVVAFPDGGSGTNNCVKKAKLLGMKVLLIND